MFDLDLETDETEVNLDLPEVPETVSDFDFLNDEPSEAQEDNEFYCF